MKAKIRFKVQNDKMAAVMLVGRPNEAYVVTMEEIEEAMAEEGIVFGVLKDRIQAAVDNQAFLSEIPCARGVEPVPGKSGELKILVQTKTELRPKIRDDGTVDYHDLGLINEIDKGRLICRRTRPTPGEDGTDIYGVPVPFTPGKYPDFPMGDGTEISKFDDTKLVAARDGFVHYEDGLISIPEVFVLNSDVNNGTGNLSFRGSIVVNGCVREGFRIKSGKDVTVNGVVEGALITAGGNVSICDGFAGMNSGEIWAGGNVDSKYLQNAVVKCGGNLTTEYAINSFLTVGGEIHAETGRGTIAGGNVHALNSVYANFIGADTYIETKIVIDDLSDKFWDYEEMNRAYHQENATTDYSDPYANDPIRNPYDAKKALEDFENDGYLDSADLALSASVNVEDEDRQKVNRLRKNKEAKIVVKGCVYPEVKLQIGTLLIDIDRETKCTKYTSENGEIIATPIF